MLIQLWCHSKKCLGGRILSEYPTFVFWPALSLLDQKYYGHRSLNNPGAMKNQVSMSCFTKPHIIGYMSVDVSRQYHQDLSQLKYITCIPSGEVALDLNHRINEAVKRTTDDNDEKISLMLKFLLDFKLSSSSAKEEPLIITYRRTLISVMCNAYSKRDQLSIIATQFKNCIYLCSVETPHDIQRRKSRGVQEQTFCAWGYKFEQYMTADLPNLKPDVNKPVIENEEFSIYYSSTFGSHKLLYGAQIDGLLATDGSVTNPPQSGNVEDNLKYLRSNDFVELKTNREIQNRKQDQNFRRYKLLRCWCQCYLAGLKGLLVGFRSDDGIVHRLQWFETQEIASYCKYDWVPETGLEFLNYFLSFLKSSFKSQEKQNDTLTLQFNIEGTSITCHETSESILPDWYLNNFNKF